MNRLDTDLQDWHCFRNIRDNRLFDNLVAYDGNFDVVGVGVGMMTSRRHNGLVQMSSVEACRRHGQDSGDRSEQYELFREEQCSFETG